MAEAPHSPRRAVRDQLACCSLAASAASNRSAGAAGVGRTADNGGDALAGLRAAIPEAARTIGTFPHDRGRGVSAALSSSCCPLSRRRRQSPCQESAPDQLVLWDRGLGLLAAACLIESPPKVYTPCRRAAGHADARWCEHRGRPRVPFPTLSDGPATPRGPRGSHRPDWPLLPT
jgi:hypothetical protein